jgi:hypothetical protein
MKKIYLMVIYLMAGTTLMAQEQTPSNEPAKNWKLGGKVGVNFAQVGFVNWAKGGENSMSGTSFLQLFANRSLDGWEWENKLDLEYGMLKNQGQNPKKTEDRIEFNSKIGKKASKKWFYSAFLNFKTQFNEGFDYEKVDTPRISNFMAPGILTLGIGMDYKPTDYFSMMISPISSKTIFVMDQELADAGQYGVKKAEFDNLGVKVKDGEQIRQEVGASLTFTFKKDIFTNVNLDTRLDLFSNYLSNPQNIDVDWQTTLTLKVNKFLNAVVKTHLIYDDDTDVSWQKDGIVHNSPITQFQQSIAVGLMYQFQN